MSLYALVVVASDGCCTTPFIVTNTFSLFAGNLDNVKFVAVLLPSKLSTLLSDISHDGKLLARNVPQKSSVETGAAENTITLLLSIQNPFEG